MMMMTVAATAFATGGEDAPRRHSDAAILAFTPSRLFFRQVASACRLALMDYCRARRQQRAPRARAAAAAFLYVLVRPFLPLFIGSAVQRPPRYARAHGARASCKRRYAHKTQVLRASKRCVLLQVSTTQAGVIGAHAAR